MSEALHVYARVFWIVFTIFVVLAIATVAIGLAIRAYAEALTPQVGGRPLVRSRRRFGAWVVILLMLAIGAACYGMISYTVARNYVAVWPVQVRSTAATTVCTVGLMSIYFVVLHSRRSKYLAYRRSTNFRIWIRGVPLNGISAAHEHYLAGWRLRAISDVFSKTLLYGFLATSLIGVTKIPTDKPFGWREFNLICAGVAALATFSLIRRMLVRLWFVLRPEYGLADLCTNPAELRAQAYERNTQRYVVYRPGGWRGQDHEDSFKIASLLEWSIRRAQGRYAQHHYDELVLATRRLAQSLRLKALEITGEADETTAAYEERKFLALQLVTGRDPLHLTSRIDEITQGDPEPPELPRQRAARLVESISGSINVHWPTVKILGIIIALAWLIWSGKLMDAVGLLK